METKLVKTDLHLLLVSNEKIKVGDYFLAGGIVHVAEEVLNCEGRNNGFFIHSRNYCNPISLCKKVVAYIPLKDGAERFNLPLLPPFQQDEINIIEKSLEYYPCTETSDLNIINALRVVVGDGINGESILVN